MFKIKETKVVETDLGMPDRMTLTYHHTVDYCGGEVEVAGQAYHVARIELEHGCVTRWDSSVTTTIHLIKVIK